LTSPGSQWPPPQPPGPPRPTRLQRISNRHLVTLAVVVGLALLLLTTHRITRFEVIIFCVILPSIILHEIAHGFVALVFGDDTAKRAGRLTLNPLAHIDPLGTVILPALMIFGGYGFFGWAKPVPVNLARLRSPRNHGVLVSLAGPATNALLAGVAAVLFHLTGAATATGSPTWVWVLFYLGLVNVWLCIFNLIPIPPLDGSVLLERALPASWWPQYLRIRHYMLPVVFVVVFVLLQVKVGGVSVLSRFQENTASWWASLL